MIVYRLVPAVFVMYKIITLFLWCLVQNFDEITNSVSAELQHSSEPLYLTYYIETKRIKEGRKAAEVKPFLPGVESYSGYLTVDKKYNSNLFFWYFPCTNANASLVIWLQGGPGSSSLFGLFSENGPYVFKKDKLKYRHYSWTKYFNVLYIDNPVGSGFSFTDSEEGYVKNQTQIGESLYESLEQFLTLFPDLQKNEIIISGESYAGKYIPSLAHTILRKSSKSNSMMKVKGLFIGNPFIDPEHMLYYNEYLFSHGFLDYNEQEEFRKREELIRIKIKAGKWAEASDLFYHTFFEGLIENNTLFYELTGLKQTYNLLQDEFHVPEFLEFVSKPQIREALHVGSRQYTKRLNKKVFLTLKEDFLQSMKPILEEVLENYPTLIYSGQLDIICPWYLQEKVFLNLGWTGAIKYYEADRKPFYWNQYLVGYFKVANNLIDVMIRNAGHMVPTDKPQWALGLLRRFSEGYFESN